MAKTKSNFVCQSCGYHSSKWLGKCPHCNSWDSFMEENNAPKKGAVNAAKAIKAVPLSKVEVTKVDRRPLSDQELNRILGGGLVPGALVLFGGEPGIGKSTLLLQLVLENNIKSLYISGEESAEQIKLRATRLNRMEQADPYLVSEGDLSAILATAEELTPELLIIDSIQTIYNPEVDGTVGSVSQIRSCTDELMHFAKRTHTPIILVGHITKEGSLAGPKVLEHMVDTVLQFEGDRNHYYRIIRSIKNRFGSTNELAIYEMTGAGLREVKDPSKALSSGNTGQFSGISTAANIEGARALFIEVQALVSKSAYGNPQRTATGFDLRRLNMLLAVLEKKCGFKMGVEDVFLNVTGGVKLEDPATDLALVAALASSKLDANIDSKVCFAGEVGLSGEIRPVQKVDVRIKEAEKLGFETIYVSKFNDFTSSRRAKINVVKLSRIGELFQHLFGAQRSE